MKAQSQEKKPHTQTQTKETRKKKKHAGCIVLLQKLQQMQTQKIDGVVWLFVERKKKTTKKQTTQTKQRATQHHKKKSNATQPHHLRHTFCCDDGMSPNQHSCTNNRKALAAPEADFRFVACCCSNNRQGKFSKRFQPLFCVLCSVTRGKLTEVAPTILQDTQRHCWWRRTHSKQVEHEMTQLAPSTVWKMTTKRHSTNYTIWARNCNCATQHKANFASCSSAPKKFELVLAQ